MQCSGMMHNARGTGIVPHCASCVVLFYLDVQGGVGIMLHYARVLFLLVREHLLSVTCSAQALRYVIGCLPSTLLGLVAESVVRRPFMFLCKSVGLIPNIMLRKLKHDFANSLHQTRCVVYAIKGSTQDVAMRVVKSKRHGYFMFT
eukprot:1029908-Heterocapsa_arctica.AAC.1